MPGKTRMVLVVGVALLGCGRSPVVSTPAHLVIIVVDALRADHLHCYGYERPTSPHIDALAADGTRFTNAVTSSPWTLPALATLFTSLYPSVHGAVRPSDAIRVALSRGAVPPVDVLDESRSTLAEVLRAAGFRTAAFVSGVYPGRPFGFAQGFERFDGDAVYVRPNVEALLDWLDRERPARFFAYLHVGEVHSPYAPPDPGVLPLGAPPALRRVVEEERGRYAKIDFDPGYEGTIDGSLASLRAIRLRQTVPSARDIEHLAALYDRGVAYVDHWIGRLVDELERRELLERTLLLVTADHGDELLEHGGIEHGRTFFDEVMRVPFVLRAPGLGRGRTVADQVAHLDVLPTALDLLAVPADLFVQGRSLRRLLDGGSLPERAIIGEAAQTPGLRAVRTTRWKYVKDGFGRETLYDLATDPGERVNRCPSESEQCASLAAELGAWEARMAEARGRLALPPAPSAAVDDETGKRLRALGYVE